VRPVHAAGLVTLSIIWGSAFMLVKVVLEEVPPMTLVAGRLTSAAVVLVGVLYATRKSFPRELRDWYPFVVLGLANNVFPFTMLTWGQQHIDSSLAAILTASMTLSTALLAHVWIGERLTADRAAGILIGFAGVVVLIGADLRDITDSSTLGQLAVLFGVLGYSVGTVFARGRLEGIDPVQAAAGQTLVGAAVMIPIALLVDVPYGDISLTPKIIAAWVTLGVVASAVAYLIFFPLIRRITATQAATVTYLIPVTAVFLGALVLDERLGANSFAGLALIILGVWIVNGGGAWLQHAFGRERTNPVQPVRGGADGDLDRPSR
jgi:drug/metabolite transporter (DMT)-like permease